MTNDECGRPFRDSLLLALITLVVCGPGLFWGFDFVGKSPYIFFSNTEWIYGHHVADYLNQGIIGRRDYFFGLVNEVRLPLLILQSVVHTLRPIHVVLTTRALNLFCAMGLVVVLFHLARGLRMSRLSSFLACGFLVGSPLFVMHSFYATPLMSCLFWSYASLLFSLLFLQRQWLGYWWMASASAGCAIAVKYGFFALVPLLYVSFFFPSKKRNIGVGWGVVALSFLVMNGGYTFPMVTDLMTQLLPDNFAKRSHWVWANPLMYAAGLIPGFGALPLLLAIRGRRGRVPFTREFFWLLECPLLLLAIVISCLTASFIRHAVPFVPYLALLAGSGLATVLRSAGPSRRVRSIILSAVFLYQGVAVFGIQKTHLFNAFSKARAYAVKHLPPDKNVVVLTRGYPGMLIRHVFPEEWVHLKGTPVDYLLLCESMTFVLKRSVLNPFTAYPPAERGYHWHLMKDPLYVQRVLQGRTPFRKLISFPAKEIIPEFILYKRWWGSFAPLVGDVDLYRWENQGGRE